MDVVDRNDPRPLTERLQEPETAASLHRLLDRLDTIERALERLAEATQQAPAFVAMAADTVEDTAGRLYRAGIDVNERLANVGALAEKLSRRETTERLAELLELADQAPGFVAMVADILDDYAQRARAQGVAIEKALPNGADAAVRLGAALTPERVRALEYLVTSLDVGTANFLGAALHALRESQTEAPERVSALGLLRKLNDPDVQRALGFLTTFAKHFGRALV